MINLLCNGNKVKFSTTMFPDGTSQVWKVEPNKIAEGDDVIIQWLFESEAELFHVCQLTHLLYTHFDVSPDLSAPYLPYGRQDKDVGNESSFALIVAKDILYHAGITRIETFDAHSKTEMIFETPNVSVQDFHRSILTHDVVCYPDKGAAIRYGSYGTPTIYCEKVRNQLTGEITGLKVIADTELTGKSILIVDDICDGGMTFIKVAEALKAYKAGPIDLAVSHGLFSKGKQVLYDAGIREIFTTNSLLRNPEGFEVW